MAAEQNAPRILLVDDEVTITNTLSVLLSCSGYESDAVNDSGKAVDMIKAGGYDLMITDLRMSPVSGLELLRIAHKEQPDMPKIMLTAYGSPEVVKEATELGATFLNKPFSPADVLGAVKEALG